MTFLFLVLSLKALLTLPNFKKKSRYSVTICFRLLKFGLFLEVVYKQRKMLGNKHEF